MAAPTINILSIDKRKISDEVGADVSTITFDCDQSIIGWEARAGGSFAGSGLLVGKGGQLFPAADLYPNENLYPSDYQAAAGADITFDVENEELQQDNIYRINIYAVGQAGGEWTPYQYKQVRYIRDWVNGSTSNGGNHWVEIKAIDKGGTNIALNKTVIADTVGIHGTSDLQTVTNGDTSTSDWLGLSSKNVIIDLGQVYEIDKIQVWHYYGDGRTYYKTKTEVSTDGSNYEVVFNSEISGTYKETSAGHEIKI